MPNYAARKTTRKAHHRANFAALGYPYSAESFREGGFTWGQVMRAFRLVGADSEVGASVEQGLSILRLLMSGAIPPRGSKRSRAA